MIIKKILLYTLFSLLLPPIVFAAEWDTVKYDSEDFILVKPFTLNKINKDLKECDLTKEENIVFESLNAVCEKTLETKDKILEGFKIKEENRLEEQLLYEQRIDNLTRQYTSEVDKVYKLESDKPCVFCWFFAGGTISLSIIGLLLIN